MKKKKVMQKLSLKKKTIVSLSKLEEQHVIGGSDTHIDCPFATRFRDCLSQYYTRCGNSCK